MIASSYTLAAAVCSLVISVYGLSLGRRGAILMGDAFVIVGGSLQASAWSVPQMIVGRILCVCDAKQIHVASNLTIRSGHWNRMYRMHRTNYHGKCLLIKSQLADTNYGPGRNEYRQPLARS